jgi:hypothetical protein
MTSFADPLRLRVVCDPCKRHGPGHAEPCTCNVITLPASKVAQPDEDEPDAYTQWQEERDRLARANDEAGDTRLRWTRCGHKDCGVQYGPIEGTFHEIDKWEADHEVFGCKHHAPKAEPLEVEDWVWPSPKPHPFRHRMEPLRETTPLQRPKRRRDDYTTHWIPAVLGSRAA